MIKYFLEVEGNISESNRIFLTLFFGIKRIKTKSTGCYKIWEQEKYASFSPAEGLVVSSHNESSEEPLAISYTRLTLFVL